MLWLMADNIEHVISYWVLFDKFDSPMLGGYAVVSHWAPYLLLGAVSGAIADRYDCRKLFVISMAMFMLVSLGWAYVFWTDSLAIWHSIVLLTLHGLAGVIFTPASQLMIHDIVEERHLASAVRLTATSRQMSLIGGPAIGGLLLLALGPAAGIAVNALIYLPMVHWSLRAPYTGHTEADRTRAPRKPLDAGLGAVTEAICIASTNRTVMAMIVLAGLTSLLVGGAYQAQMPEFADSFLGRKDGLLYTLLLLAGGIGAICGGILQEALRSFAPSPLKAAVIAIIWSISMIAFAAAPNYVVALVALFVAGALLICFTSMAQALVQLQAPAEGRGQVIGLFNMSLNGSRVGSGLTVGFLGAAIGIHWSLGLSAALLAVVVVPIVVYVRKQRVQPTPTVVHSEICC
jgi:MFS family permease